MKFFNFVALSAILFFCSACTKKKIDPEREEIFNIESSFTGNSYQAKVLLPQNYDPNQSYPIAYLLDGHYHYEEVAAKMKAHSNLEEVILVALFYQDLPFAISNLGAIEELREQDFTYPVHTTQSGTDLGGGGIEFYRFLSEELVPLIEQSYPSKPESRTLMGHSLGGYFALWQLFEYADDPTFPQVIALSPSLWWSQLELMEMEEAAHLNGQSLPYSLYLGIGTHEGIEAGALVEELDSRMVDHAHPDLVYQKETYTGGHFHSAKDGFERGLKHLFP